MDSCDSERLGIAKQELLAMLEEEELKDAILLVFANKQDSKGAYNAQQVRYSQYYLFKLCIMFYYFHQLCFFYYLLLCIIIINNYYVLFTIYPRSQKLYHYLT